MPICRNAGDDAPGAGRRDGRFRGRPAREALGLALADLYLTGHSLPSIGGEVITLPALGIALSPAGILLLAAAAGAGWLAWWVTGRESRAP